MDQEPFREPRTLLGCIDSRCQPVQGTNQILQKCTLRVGLEPARSDEVVERRPGDAGDLGDGTLRYAEIQEVPDLFVPAVQARHAQRSLWSAQPPAGRPGSREAFAGALGDEVALDLREQGEHRGHDLGLDVAPSFEPDVLLDRDEEDAGLGDGVEHGDDFAEGAAEARQLADDETVAGLERSHELVEPPALGVGPR